MRRALYFIFTYLFTFFPAFAQGVKNLPDDPRIHKGSIANGFSYYLIDNDIRPGYADFYLVRKVGSIHEEGGEYGFNAILGTMGVKGTRNFPNNAITSYFDELGLDHNSDFKIVNGVESSYYKVANIPVEKGGSVVDSTLLILYNWASGINLDEEDVEIGKLLYANSIVGEMDYAKRGEEAHLSRFAGKDTVSAIMDINTLIPAVREYKAKDIRSFYYKWFSPENMSLIVVGDVDVKTFETKVKSLFQALPKFLGESSERHLTLKGHEEPIVSVVSDKEGTQSSLSIRFTTNSLPENLRSTAVPYVEEYITCMIEMFLTERLARVSQVGEFKFFVRDVTFGRIMGGTANDELKIDLLLSSDDVAGVLEAVLKELYGLKKNGVSNGDFERLQGQFFKDINHQYDWRILTPNEIYARRAMDNFLYGTSLASIEMKKEYMDMVRYQVGREHFNMFVSSLLRDGDNCVVCYTCPDNEYVRKSSESELRGVIKKVMSDEGSERQAVDVRPYVAPQCYPQVAGTILSEHPEMITDSKIWTLSNGATVVYKQTQVEPNKFLFHAISKGGLTLMPGNNYAREYINEISAASPVGGLSPAELFIHKKNEKMTLDRKFDLNTSILTGGAYSSSLEDFMKMVHLHFLPVETDLSVYDSYRKTNAEALLCREFSPESIFEDTLSRMLYNESKFITVPDVQEFEKVDYGSALSFINDRFSNAANFHFIIIGDLDEVALKDLVCRYIASLPGNPAEKETWRNVPIYLRKYDQKKTLEMGMEYPRTIYNFSMIAPSPYTLKGVVNMNISSEVLQKRVCREMMDRGFPIEVKSGWIRHPEDFMSHSFKTTAREFSTEFEELLSGVLKSLLEDGASSMEIKNAKMVLMERFKRGESESMDFWREILVNRFIYGKDFYSRYSDFIVEATDDQINDAIREYISNATNTTLILKGTN